MEYSKENAQNKLDKLIEVVGEDMETIRVGGASPRMVQDIMVNAYGGQRMKIMEVATVTTPDPTQILITPWDRSVVKDVEKGILEANLGLVPNTAGESIRIVIPPLTEERRRDFVKLAHQKLESGRVMLRQIRQEMRESIEKQKDHDGVSEDDIKRQLEELDKLTGEYNTKLETMAAEKEKAIMWRD